MSHGSVPVDLYNPGQVLACIGFAEIADRLMGGAGGHFDWSDPGQVRFHLHADGDEDPVRAVLRFLDRAEVVSLAPAGSENRTAKWEVDTVEQAPGAPFPTPDVGGPPQLPAQLRADGVTVNLHSWADGPGSNGRDNLKFWAGAGGYPGAAFVRDALVATARQGLDSAEAPFSLAADLGSNLRLDWRGGYVPLDIGFSLNSHTNISSVGFPLVELLGAAGLAHARPLRVNKLAYRYAVVGVGVQHADASLPLPLLRAALGTVPLPFPTRSFTMRLGWAGQEGQARTITSVTEESSQ